MTKTFIYSPTEDQEQTAVIQWSEVMANQLPELRLLYHVPNGGFRIKSEASRFKRLGVKSGVPDLCLPVARHGYHGLYIEMKRKTGGRLRDDQKQWIDDLYAEGYLAVRCDGADAAIDVLQRYLQ